MQTTVKMSNRQPKIIRLFFQAHEETQAAEGLLGAAEGDEAAADVDVIAEALHAKTMQVNALKAQIMMRDSELRDLREAEQKMGQRIAELSENVRTVGTR